jgi:hypothetical protein
MLGIKPSREDCSLRRPSYKTEIHVHLNRNTKHSTETQEIGKKQSKIIPPKVDNSSVA